MINLFLMSLFFSMPLQNISFAEDIEAVSPQEMQDAQFFLLEVPAEQLSDEDKNNSINLDDQPAPAHHPILLQWSGVNIGMHMANFTGMTVGSGLNFNNRAQFNVSAGYAGLYKYEGPVLKADLRIYPVALDHRFDVFYIGGRYFHEFVMLPAVHRGSGIDVAQVNVGWDLTRLPSARRHRFMSERYFEIGVGERFGATPSDYSFKGTYVNVTVGAVLGGRWRNQPAARPVR